MDRCTDSARERGFGYLPSSLSPAFSMELDKAKRFASYDGFAILILGETGTGKTLMARYLHLCGPRRDKPFVEVDCTSISPTLAESELFGHVKGAFTGADQDRPGRVRKADTGTLFLDEIGELNLTTQAKLLKVLEDKALVPVGSESRIFVDVQVVVATNRDLEAMVREGSFRRDLYERIKNAILRMPPLRQRREEIPGIVDCAFREWNAASGEFKRPGSEFMKAIMDYDWPGNVRELRYAVRHACALCQDRETLPAHLPEPFSGGKCPGGRDPRGASGPSIPEGGMCLKEAMRDIEWSYFQAALRISGGNTAKAASLLGMSGYAFRKALRERFALRFVES